jgi:hypothetical protein
MKRSSQKVRRVIGLLQRKKILQATFFATKLFRKSIVKAAKIFPVVSLPEIHPGAISGRFTLGHNFLAIKKSRKKSFKNKNPPNCSVSFSFFLFFPLVFLPLPFNPRQSGVAFLKKWGLKSRLVLLFLPEITFGPCGGNYPRRVITFRFFTKHATHTSRRIMQPFFLTTVRPTCT